MQSLTYSVFLTRLSLSKGAKEEDCQQQLRLINKSLFQDFLCWALTLFIFLKSWMLKLFQCFWKWRSIELAMPSLYRRTPAIFIIRDKVPKEKVSRRCTLFSRQLLHSFNKSTCCTAEVASCALTCWFVPCDKERIYFSQLHFLSKPTQMWCQKRP